MKKKKEEIRIWEIGKEYVIRTVTMIDVGTLVAITEHEIVLKNASWIADTGRWNHFLEKGMYSESEPYPDGIVIVGRGSVVDATIWKHGVIRKVK